MTLVGKNSWALIRSTILVGSKFKSLGTKLVILCRLFYRKGIIFLRHSNIMSGQTKGSSTFSIS